MKRDMDLVRYILRSLEDRDPDAVVRAADLSFPGSAPPSGPEVDEHCRLIVERGLARGDPTLDGWVLSGLTWEGHDFLDNSRESKVWQAAKKAAGGLSFGVFVRVLSEVATRYAMSQIVGF